MRRSHFTRLLLALLAAGGLALAGCAAKPEPRPLPPLVRAAHPGQASSAGHARQSLVLDPPALRGPRPGPAANARRPMPWYAYRNDIPRSITLGISSSTRQSSYTRTVDRLGAFHGNVIDHYQRRTYRTRYRQTTH